MLETWRAPWPGSLVVGEQKRRPPSLWACTAYFCFRVKRQTSPPAPPQ